MKLAILLATLVLSGPAVSMADGMTSTLTLDGLSFISFGDERVFQLPAGSTIRFQFGDANPDGSVPFTVEPSDVAIAPIALGESDGELRYSLASAAGGTLKETATGRQIDMNASVRATLAQPGGEGSYTYALPFTTETTSAESIAGDLDIEITGMRLVDGVWYVQLVGGTTNKENAFPEPGTAVYTVLSGSFDQVP